MGYIGSVGWAIPQSSNIQLVVASLLKGTSERGGSHGVRAELSLGHSDFEKLGGHSCRYAREELDIENKDVTEGQS